MADRVMHVEFVVLTLVGLSLPIFAPSNNRRLGRRIFWGGFLLATVSAFFISYPPDWKTGAGLSLLAAIVLLIPAYFGSPYIKIRGKIYAIGIEDTRPDPAPDGTPVAVDGPDPTIGSYSGAITAQKLWRLAIFVTGLFAFGVISYSIDGESPGIAWMSAAALVGMAATIGYGDASEGHPVARGQRIPFVIIAIITGGVFTVIYLVAYRTGKHWPLRRHRQLRSRPDAARQPNHD